jgi:tRNA-dihydrouridine synthase B
MSLVIGPHNLSSPVILAPMAGVTDLPFRRLVKQFGAGLVVSEMVASQAVLRGNKRTRRMATGGDDEEPLSVQIVGCEPEAMAEAARINADQGAAIIDINMGCPAKKIVKGEAGSALMRDEPLATKILEAVVKAVNVPVTLKMRTGWDEANRNAPRLAKIAEECGISLVTVHGRTRSQFYGGQADWKFIGEVKSAVRIPVIGNGDVRTPEDAAELLKVSGADGVMIGRASYGRPWLLSQVGHYLATGQELPEPGLVIRYRTLLAHFEAMLEHYGIEAAVPMARKHIAWYTKGYPGSAEFRAEINRIPCADAVRQTIRAFYEPLLEKEAA